MFIQTYFALLELYNKRYFEAARRLQNRSLLGVNEDFAIKADAERALLDNSIRVLLLQAVSMLNVDSALHLLTLCD